MKNSALRTAMHAAALVLLLAAAAFVAPAPASSDSEIYQTVGRQLVIPDCADGHCFRPLVAGVLEHLPGPSLVKWKAYAVIANVIGALAVGRFCLLLGLSTAAAVAATWLSALGAGALYSLFDCYTSDPLMYMLGPLMTVALWQARVRRAAMMGTIGVLAKEFAAVPLWIFTMMACLERRWRFAIRMLLTSVMVTLIWLAVHTWLMTLHNYRYGASASADLLHGGFLATWIRGVGPMGAIRYLFTSYSAVYLLLPLGFYRSGRRLQLLALASLPTVAALVYVEQPERALWNFHFIAIPIAAIVLQELPGWARALFIASFGVVNLRFGAQLPIASASRIALVISLLLALAAVVLSIRKTATATIDRRVESDRAVPPRRAWTIAAVQAAAFAFLCLALVDVRAHRRTEADFGINQFGYRGPLRTARHPGVRVAVLGGSAAFAQSAHWAATVPAQLEGAINTKRRWTTPGGPFARVDNLAEPAAGVHSYAATLRAYDFLDHDIVCIFDGYDAVAGGSPRHGRHRSLVFRTAGYLPQVGVRLLRRPHWMSDPDGGIASILQDGSSAAGDPSCAGVSAPYCSGMTAAVRAALDDGRAVVVATPPYVSARHEAQQRSLAEALDRTFGHEPRFRYVNLGEVVDLRDPAQSADGIHPTPGAARTIAAALADGVVELIPRDDSHGL